VDQAVIDHIMDACDGKKKREILETREEIGPVRLGDVEAAQTRIVNALRVMEENGEIIAARQDELVP
jgi:flagellar motor switch protein FliG